MPTFKTKKQPEHFTPALEQYVCENFSVKNGSKDFLANVAGILGLPTNRPLFLLKDNIDFHLNFIERDDWV